MKGNFNNEIYNLLEMSYIRFNKVDFIEYDPISIPHLFTKQQDIEIMGFWAATLAWGQRKTIINNCKKLVEWMDGAPHQFILHHQESDLKPFVNFKHRTFNGDDALYFIAFLKDFFSKNNSLENAFTPSIYNSDTTENALIHFKKQFFGLEFAPKRTQKHVSSPISGTTCKRLNMFLRWMVRYDDVGVDFGIWKNIKPSQLIIPCDVHVDRVARQMGLITRKQTDWKTAIELTQKLKEFDELDPVKYDFALFGLGIFEGF